MASSTCRNGAGRKWVMMIRRVRNRESASYTACSACRSPSRLGTGSAGSSSSLDASRGRKAVQAALYLFLAALMISLQPGSALTWITDGAAALPQQGPDAYEAAVSQLAAQANLSIDPVGQSLQDAIGVHTVCWVVSDLNQVG